MWKHEQWRQQLQWPPVMLNAFWKMVPMAEKRNREVGVAAYHLYAQDMDRSTVSASCVVQMARKMVIVQSAWCMFLQR